jgi:hypothetical protein
MVRFCFSGAESSDVIAALEFLPALAIKGSSCCLKSKSSARGYNWTTLFLGVINTGTWPSRLGESQMRQ